MYFSRERLFSIREVKINLFTGMGTGSIILFGSFTDI